MRRQANAAHDAFDRIEYVLFFDLLAVATDAVHRRFVANVCNFRARQAREILR